MSDFFIGDTVIITDNTSVGQLPNAPVGTIGTVTSTDKVGCHLEDISYEYSSFYFFNELTLLQDCPNQDLIKELFS